MFLMPHGLERAAPLLAPGRAQCPHPYDQRRASPGPSASSGEGTLPTLGSSVPRRLTPGLQLCLRMSPSGKGEKKVGI